MRLFESGAMKTLRVAALDVLLCPDADAKAARTRALPVDAPIGADEHLAEPAGVPGRPPKPELVAPSRLPQRSLHTLEGRAALLHAMAHIEFNAINLALDAVWRFARHAGRLLPRLAGKSRARRPALHLLREHLRSLGHDYGDFAAHDGLWEMAEKTTGDILARMALVPRTLEASGLDATPPMKAKLLRPATARRASILDVILRDEIGHVAIGNRWFRWLCTQRGLDPIEAYAGLAARYGAPKLRGPFNLEARRAAGFDEAELALLDAR